MELTEQRVVMKLPIQSRIGRSVRIFSLEILLKAYKNNVDAVESSGWHGDYSFV